MEQKDNRKIYIVGSVASGKTTLAKCISSNTGIPCHSLDLLVHKKDETTKWRNTTREETERDMMFDNILGLPAWIIEDVGRECFRYGLSKADTIILMYPPPIVRYTRILLRHCNQKLGIQKCDYTPSIMMIKHLFKRSHDFETGNDGLKEILKSYDDKTVVLRNKQQVNEYLRGYL